MSPSGRQEIPIQNGGIMGVTKHPTILVEAQGGIFDFGDVPGRYEYGDDTECNSKGHLDLMRRREVIFVTSTVKRMQMLLFWCRAHSIWG